MVGCTFGVWIVAGATELAARLRPLGYDWAIWRKCTTLQNTVPRLARRLPPRDELAVIPGYEDSPAGMMRFLFELKAELEENWGR